MVANSIGLSVLGNSATNSNHILTSIIQNQAANTTAIAARISNLAPDGTTLFITGRNQFFDIAGQTTNIINVSGANSTTANLINVSGNALTTGGCMLLQSSSADTSARNLLRIINSNAASTGAICFNISQTGNAQSILISHNATTATGLFVGANSLTTGSVAQFVSNTADTSARNLVQIQNVNAAAIGAKCLDIVQAGEATALGG